MEYPVHFSRLDACMLNVVTWLLVILIYFLVEILRLAHHPYTGPQAEESRESDISSVRQAENNQEGSFVR